MSEETKHTEDELYLPWRSGSGGQCIEDANGYMVADLGFYGAESGPVREHILHACNNYEAQEAKIKALLEACKDFVKDWSHFCKHVDFARSNLDARSIQFMNEVPGKIASAIALAEKGE